MKTVWLCLALFFWGDLATGQEFYPRRNSEHLSGRVVGSGGLAVSGLQLWARQVRTYSKREARFGGAAENLEGAGWWEGLCKTDKEGHFRLDFMQPGSYELLCPAEADQPEGWVRLNSEPLLTGTRNLVVQYDQPVIQVRLLDRYGRKWSGERGKQKNNLGGFNLHPRFNFGSWPSTPQVMVRWAGPTGPGSLRRRLRKPIHWVSQNLLFTTAVPGQTYAVQVLGGGFQGKVQYVTANNDGSAAVIEVRAEKPAPMGTLQVIPRSSGEVIGKGGYELGFSLWVADLESGFPLLGRGESEEGPSEFKLPAGKFRVILEGESVHEMQHGTRITPRLSGRVESVVEIQAGVHQIINLDMDAGGFLRIAVEGKTTLADIEVARDRWKWAQGNEAWITGKSSEVAIVIQRPNFLAETVSFAAISREGTSAHGTHIHRRWPFGETHKSEMLPAGTFELTAIALSGRKVTQQIRIEPGETLDLVLKIPDEL